MQHDQSDDLYNLNGLGVEEIEKILEDIRSATKNDPTFVKFSIFIIAALDELEKLRQIAQEQSDSEEDTSKAERLLMTLAKNNVH